jgi:hypothetical protein
MKRVRADFVSQRSIIEWVDGVRARVLSIREAPGGVILHVQPDRMFDEPVDLWYARDEWVTVCGYSLQSEGWR